MDAVQSIYEEKAADLKDITHHAHWPIVLQGGGWRCVPMLYPDYDVVSQTHQEHNHLLSLKALLATLGETQTLLVAFERGFHATAALVVEVNVRQQDMNGIQVQLCLVARQFTHLSGK